MVTFQKIVSFTAVAVFFLITIVFLTSYTSMKVNRATTNRLHWISQFLELEKAATNEYPYNLDCYEYKTIDGWKKPLIYKRINDGKDYVLFSVGKDQIPYTDDDVHTKKLNLHN